MSITSKNFIKSYRIEIRGGVNSEERNFIDFGSEHRKLSVLRLEGEAAVARRVTRLAREERFVAGERDAEGEPVPPLHRRILAGAVHAVLIVRVYGGDQDDQGEGYGSDRNRLRRHRKILLCLIGARIGNREVAWEAGVYV